MESLTLVFGMFGIMCIAALIFLNTKKGKEWVFPKYTE